MDNRKTLWIIFILISLCHRSESIKAGKVTFTGQDQDQPLSGHAVNNGGCDCDVLETRDPQFPSGGFFNNNFTKQPGDLNGQPFYFSVKPVPQQNYTEQGFLPSILLTWIQDI